MPNKIILDNKVVEDQWQLITDNSLAEGKVILPLSVWNENHESLSTRDDIPGLLLASDESPEDFLGEFSNIPLVAVEFPAFADGRVFSIGNMLRERFKFAGELRACGNYIRDQLYYLKRCGFNAFDFETKEGLEEALKSLEDFSDNYQRAANQDTPLYRRR